MVQYVDISSGVSADTLNVKQVSVTTPKRVVVKPYVMFEEAPTKKRCGARRVIT